MNEAGLQKRLDDRVERHEFSGVALAWREGRPLFRYAGGLAHRGHRIPITMETRFAVASVTKLVTATVALRLVERGLVRLDQPLTDVLPAHLRPAAMTQEHTLHHLLSHTSGLADYHDGEDETWASFMSCWERIPTHRLRRPADMLPLFADLPAVSLPGARYQYVDANFIVAGLVTEQVGGRPFADAVADDVTRPAGMVDTAIEALDAEPAGLATGYMTVDEGGAPESWRPNTSSVPVVGMPDGGMITTADDLARLVDRLLDGTLLSSAMVTAMTSPQGPPSDAVQQYGYGCQLAVERGEVTIVGHGGSDPGVSARVSHHRRSATTIVALCNQDRGSWAATLDLQEALGLEDPRRF